MSIKGSPGQWFEAAVRRGDLTGALAELPALGRPLSLAYALAVTVLLVEHHDPRHPRAAARWAARLTLDRETVTLSDLTDVVYALALLEAGETRGRAALLEVLAEHDVAGIDRLIGDTDQPRRRGIP